MTSKLFTRTAISLISISMLLMSNTVFAKWEMVVTNNSTMPVTASRAVKANSTVTDFVGLGAAGVSIEFPFGVGFIQMTDLGRTNNSSNLPSWGVKICHYHEVKEFYYEGGGKLGITIASDGNVTFQALSKGSKIVVDSPTRKCNKN